MILLYSRVGSLCNVVLGSPSQISTFTLCDATLCTIFFFFQFQHICHWHCHCYGQLFQFGKIITQSLTFQDPGAFLLGFQEAKKHP